MPTMVDTPEPTQAAPRAQRQPLDRNKVMLAVVAGMFVVILIVLFSVLHQRNQLKSQVNELSTGQNSGTDDTQKYNALVSKIVDVPNGVTPQVRVLADSDISQLSADNTLYKSAKTGDVFLLYQKPDKNLFLIVYRPSSGKVVLATLGSSGTSAATQPTTPTSVTKK